MIAFILTFCFNITSVYASPCSIHGMSDCSTSIDDEGNKCRWNGKPTEGNSSGSCQSTDENGNWIEEGLPNFLKDQKTVSCGNIKNIPDYIPFITELTINIFAIISVGMLVIMGTVDLFRGVVSGKPDDMKKNQKAFFGRLTSAIIIFVLVALTKLLVSFFAKISGGGFGIVECIDCFINNKCS